MFAGNISVHGTDAERRGQREIRDPVIGCDPFHQFGGQLGIVDAFADERMEDGAAGQRIKMSETIPCSFYFFD